MNKPKLVLRPLWQIILVVVAAISIPLTVIILNSNIDWRSGASPTENPAEIVISNISDTSATISFETRSQKTKSLLNYGEQENNLNNSSFDERRKYDTTAPEIYKLHYHKLVNLKPNKEYFFSLTIGDKIYTNSSYKFKTLVSSALQVPAPLNGTVNGGDFDEGIMYIHLKADNERSSIISELLPKNGNFAVSLSSAVDKTGSTFLTNHSEPEIYIFVNASDKGKGAVKTTKDATSISIDLKTNYTQEFNPETVESELNADTVVTLTPSATTVPATPTATPADMIDSTSQKLTYETIDIDSKELITPKNLAISNPSTTSFTVSWTTNKPVKGSVAYGINRTPETLTFDKRDNASNQQTRFSHIVDIQDNTLKSGDIINIIIVSDDKEFINGNEYYKYKVPSVESAPNPSSIEGKIIPDFTSDKTAKDFIILAKTSSSSWISAAVNEDLNFTLSSGSLLNKELTDNISINENDLLIFEIYGEGNSHLSTSYTYKTDEVKEFTIQQGLTIDSIDNGYQIPPGGKISGTSQPNSDITLILGDSDPVTVKTDSNGKWNYSIPSNANEGNQNLKITNDNSEIELEVTIQLDELPITNPTPTPSFSITPTVSPTGNLADTALDQNQLGYFYGFIIFMVGIYLLRLADKKKY